MSEERQNRNCEHCGKPLPRGCSARVRYCPGGLCRQAAYRARRQQKAKPAKAPPAHTGTCSHCGASLNGRKDGVCSDRCYYHAHKGLLPRHMMHLTTYDEELIPLITLEDQRRFKEATLS